MATYRILGPSTLTILLFSSIACGFAQEVEEEWNLYDFEDTRYVEFAVTVTEDGETKHGFSILEFEDKGDDQLSMHFKGALDDMSAEFTTTGPADQIQGQAMMQVMMTPAAAPFAVTVFAPTLGVFFAGHTLESSSGWKFNDGEQEFSFNVEGSCSYAGLEGKQVVWRVDGEARSEVCINKGVPLPLAVSLRGDEGEVYEIEMKKYVSR
jgi:hypothetical protein